MMEEKYGENNKIDFPDHPFKVLMNEDLEQLVESVKRNGVMPPASIQEFKE